MVSRTDGLGDVIVTLPIAVALKERLPGVEVAYLVSRYTAPIVRRIAEIDRVFTPDERGRALTTLRSHRPDAIVFARPEFRLALDALLARIDVRIGTGYRLYSGLFTRWVYEHRKMGAKHEARYGVNLLGPLFPEELQVRMPRLEVSEAGAAEARHRLEDVGIGGELMVIHPGSRGSAGQYPPERYQEVARRMIEEFPDLSVAITAGPGEEDLARRVAGDLPGSGRVRVVEDLSLDGLSELLRMAAGFLGSSSGPAHLAALVGAPVVGLYPGLPPTWPARWRPLGRKVTTLVPAPEEPFCPECDRHEPENCVGRISVARVIEACRGMLVGTDEPTDYIS